MRPSGRPASAASLRCLDEKLRRMADAKVDRWKRQAELRQRARTLLEASDQAMLARARLRLAGIRNRNHAISFELTGSGPEESIR